MNFLDRISGLIHSQMLFSLALLIIPLKLLMLRVSKDEAGERDALLAIPEDLAYVTMGVILSSVTGGAGPFQRLLSETTHPRLNVLLLLLINSVIAIFIRAVGQRTKLQFQSWQAALAIKEKRDGPLLSGDLPLVYAETEEADENIRHIQFFHFFAFVSTLSVQILAIAPWLLWVGRLMRAS